MKITAVETINLAEFPNVLWVQIHTDEGIVGLGHLADHPDRERFRGTCYRAANWIRSGATKGRTRQDRFHALRVPIKDVYVYPLDQRFRQLEGVLARRVRSNRIDRPEVDDEVGQGLAPKRQMIIQHEVNSIRVLGVGSTPLIPSRRWPESGSCCAPAGITWWRP